MNWKKIYVAFSSKTKHLPLKFIKILRDGKTEYAVKIRYNFRIFLHERYQNMANCNK